MAVLPGLSCQALPKCYHPLMNNSESEIIDLYPLDFKLDTNGQIFAYLGVVLLPFIDMPRLLRAMKKADADGANLTAGERERNKRYGDVYLFFQHDDDSGSEMKSSVSE